MYSQRPSNNYRGNSERPWRGSSRGEYRGGRGPPVVKKTGGLHLFFAVAKGRELHSKIVKSEKNVKIATPLACVKLPDSRFTVIAREKVHKSLRFT